jgi:hypothetical protein
MRAVPLLLVAMMVTIDAAPTFASRAWQEQSSVVTIQIHDYEHLPSDRLLHASEIVTRIYGQIGIRIEWLGVLRPDARRRRAPDDAPPRDMRIAQVTLIIMKPEMAARGRIPADILGYAAVPADGGMGRIAYVIYDRIRQVAATGPARETELLGFVMAHETGHLLLGRGSGTRTGLMKCHWDRRSAQLLDPSTLGFSDLQAFRIHTRLMNGSSPPALAADGDTDTGDAR